MEDRKRTFQYISLMPKVAVFDMYYLPNDKCSFEENVLKNWFFLDPVQMATIYGSGYETLDQ